MKHLTKSYYVWVLIPLFLFSFQGIILAQNPQVRTISQQQKDPPAKEQLAREYYKNKDYEKAAELFSQLYEKAPSSQYYIYYFNCLLYLKDYKTAEKLVKKQRKLSSGVRYDIDQAYVYDLQGESRKAQNIIYKLMDEVPDDPNRIRQLAIQLQAKGYYNQALEVYTTAQSMGAGYNYFIEMANVYQYSGEYEKMFDAYLSHLEMNPAEIQMIKNRLQNLTRIDVDDNMSQILRTKLLERAQSDPDNMVFAEMLMWYSLQVKDFDMAFRQARAMDLRFGDRDEELLSLAEIALSNKDYDMAEKSYNYVKEKKFDTPYYFESYDGYYNTLVLKAEGNPQTDIKAYKDLKKTGLKAIEELGLNSLTIQIAENLGRVMAYHLGDYEEAIDLLERAAVIEPMKPDDKANIKLLYADVLMIQNKVWDASLLYSQIESEMKHEPIGHEAKLRNAKLFYYKGEYAWAQTRLDVLKSATSKLIANDAMELSLFIGDIYEEDTMGFTLRMFGTSDLLFSQLQYDSALIWLDKIEEFPSGPNSSEYVIYKKAVIFTAKNDFDAADSLYTKLYTNYPESIKADNAIFQSAELNRLYLNNEEKAMELYLLLMTDYPDSMYSGESRVKYRAIREKNLS
ncbi:MAG: tetratricopeptide repeat protein [Bacteroidetes bacterium]|nr:tetratricopeptide repeat protein [Bacteroidota bacterium]